VDQAESVIATLKEDLAASQAQCNSLKLRNEELEEQYSLLWSSTSHPSEAKVDPSASTSKGCDKCYNIDLESYATNLANMKALKKEIAMLNSIIASGCMSESNKRRRFTKKESWIKVISQVLDMLKGARQMEGKLSKKRNALNSRSQGFCLPRPRRFRARSPEVLESGSLEPYRQENPEVPGSVRTEQRRKARFSTNMCPRPLTLVCRSKAIHSCLGGTCLPTRTRLMHQATYPLAMY
jgi:hypothetical protein